MTFGSGCEYGRLQGNPGERGRRHRAEQGLHGRLVVEMTQYGTHCNDVTSAETVMMMKEHITEPYGPIRYTMSNGESGGAHQQNLHASNYPGIAARHPSPVRTVGRTRGRRAASSPTAACSKRYYDSRRQSACRR